jgi:predicted site-specific integrase-resolvase
MQSIYPDTEIVRDIGSGLNFKRKRLLGLLVRLMRGDKLTVIVACRDILCRFGFELFEFMAQQNFGGIVVLENSVHGWEAELTADLLSILHVFSCGMYGLRSQAAKILQDPNIFKP